MARYDAVADLSFRVDDVTLDQTRMDTSSGFERVTTTITLGGPADGRGEDVTYDTPDHERLVRAGPPDLAGDYTLAEFSRALDDTDLWPDPPEREVSRHYRRWAYESAALDAALRQNDLSFGDALDTDYDPVRFVVSTRLTGDPPDASKVREWLDIDPDSEFKLDATPDWSPDLCAELADTGAVRVVDLKGHYEGTDVDNPGDPDFYARILDSFPDAIIEDPALTDDTLAVLADDQSRVSFDAPITSVQSVRDLPFEPDVLNVKPSRFGTVESLLEFIDHADEHDIDLYGGGQFELGVGRDHLHALASLFYPDSPNDVAPAEYNRPEPASGLPKSPLSPPTDPRGLDW